MSSEKLKLKVSNKELARRKKLLSPIYRFGFKTRKNFNFGEKVAIARAWEKYRTEIEHITERKIAVFVPATKAQIKRLKDRFITTNKGIIVYRPERDRKPKIVGRGRKTSVKIEFISRTEIFIPYSPPPDFLTWALKVVSENKPESVMLAVGKYKGTSQYDIGSFMRYIRRDIAPVIEYYEGLGQAHPYTGLYLIISNRKKSKRQMERIEEVLVEEFFEGLD